MSRMQRCAVALAALSLGVVFVGSGIAEAGFGASATPTFPTVVRVGDVGVPASVEVQNLNTTPDTNTANTVCNFGDGLSCPPGDPGITLIPSCAQLGAFSACTGPDPGVFQVSSTGVGDVGTACAGVPFTITLIDQVFGQLRFTPLPLGTHVVLPNTGSLCRINFTFDVLKSPSLDQNPQLPGSQTVQVVDNTQSGSTTGSGRGTSSGTTVLRATPTISTTASASIPLGGQLFDTIVVSGLVNPQLGATVDVRLYGPNDATCSGAPVFTTAVPYPVGGGPVASSGFTPTVAGVYRWVATYSGDANNAPVSGACNDANESVTVSSATPTIATNTSATVDLGAQLIDIAIVSGRVNPLPGATVTMRLYGPNDGICSGAPAFESVVPYPVSGGPVTSAPFTPTVGGVYRWIATYSGDANNASVSGVCNEANETVTVVPVPPPLPDNVSQVPIPPVAGPTPLLPATGSMSSTLLFLAFGLVLTGGLMVRSTRRS